jgi:septum formation protein
MSAVRMRRLSEVEIEQYLQSGVWRGKAGGYGIQDNHNLVTCTAGDRTTVIGLPMKLTMEMLAEVGLRPGG